MKTVKNFLVDLTFSLLISLPCFFLCDMIGKKEVVDWFDLQLGLGGVAFLLLNGIKAMAVEKGNPMYINSGNGAPLQVQVMGKDLPYAQKVIK